MKPIVIVQHEADAGPGYFAHYLLKSNLPYQTVRVFAGDPMPSSAQPYAGICSLGGSMSVNDDLPWIDEELALMRDADGIGVPIIGHCLGGQLLAKACGAQVARNAVKEIGWNQVEVDDAVIARNWIGDQSSFELFQWHEDTFALPFGARRFL
ncbi:MAG: type 1 glutamine amidotransferase, partial [Burkholderiaceae bacterium]